MAYKFLIPIVAEKVTDMDEVRERIEERIKELGTTYAEVSLKIGRSHSYMQQFMKRRIPAKLPEEVRNKLSVILRLSEEDLGAPKKDPKEFSRVNENIIDIPEYKADNNHLLFDNNDKVASHTWQFPKEYFENLKLNYKDIFIFEILDDVMLPALTVGEKIMVDQSDKDIGKPGIFLLSDGRSTMVRRIERVPGTEEILLVCDNENYKTHQVKERDISINGRVVWAARLVK